MTTALDLEAARFRLGLSTGSDLARAALDATVAGRESESLVRLAGETDPILSEASPLFERALEELGLAIPPKYAACWVVLRHHMTRIVNGQIDPRAGVRAIVTEVVDPGDLHEKSVQFVGDSHDLHAILGGFYALDDIEERPGEVSCDGRYGAEAIAAVEGRMLALATEWLQKHEA